MPDKVTVVRNDGTLLDATPEQAERLKLLGYREQTPQENEARLGAESKAEFYSTPEQQAGAGVEGFSSGLSFGLSDYTQGLLWGDEVHERARYNPGTRMATETLGALAPLLLTGGESASVTAAQLAEEGGAINALRAGASVAPTSLLSEGAGTLARLGASEGSLANTVLRGAIEGGAYGGAGAADHAWLDGDPLTAETILHGVGWGSVLGGGLSALGHGLGRVADLEAAKLHETPTPGAKDVAEVGGKSYEALRSEVQNLHEELNAAVKSSDAVMKGAADIARNPEAKALAREVSESQILSESSSPLRESPATLNVTESQIVHEAPVGSRTEAPGNTLTLGTRPVTESQIISEAPATLNVTDSQIVGSRPAGTLNVTDSQILGSEPNRPLLDYQKAVVKAGKLYDQAMGAADRGNFKGAMDAAAQYSDHMKALSGQLGVQGIGSSDSAMKNLIELRALRAELRNFPRSIDEFAGMSPKRAERLFAALDSAGKVQGVRAGAVKDAVNELVTDLGLSPEKGLRQAYKVAKEMTKSAAKPASSVASEGPEGGPEAKKAGLLRQMAGFALGGKAYGAIRVAGGDRAMAYMGYRAVKHAVTAGGADLAGLRGAVISKLRGAAASYLPAAGAGLKLAAPRVEPLLASLVNGRLDSDTKDLRELAQRRAREVGDLGPVIRDYLYKQIEPLAAVQPKLAPALHQAGVASFEALQAMLPKDPGVISKLQSIWKPSDVQAVVMAKQLEVFHDPVGVATDMLRTGQFDPVKISAMKDLSPQIWQTMRVELLKRVTSPEVRDKMSYQDQIGLSAMLDIPIHSSMQPSYIATSQAMFTQRSQPLSANPRMGQGGEGTLPQPQDNANSTQSQRSTAR